MPKYKIHIKKRSPVIKNAESKVDAIATTPDALRAFEVSKDYTLKTEAGPVLVSVPSIAAFDDVDDYEPKAETKSPTKKSKK